MYTESENNTEVFTNQHGEKMTMMFNPETGNIKVQHDDVDEKFYPLMQFVNRFNLDNEEKAALLSFYKSKHKISEESKDDKLTDEEKAMIDKYEEEEANREVPRDYASMYERFQKIAGLDK